MKKSLEIVYLASIAFLPFMFSTSCKQSNTARLEALADSIKAAQNSNNQGAAAGYCTECGNPVPEGAKFCPKCGNPVYGNGSSNGQQPGQRVSSQPIESHYLKITSANDHGNHLSPQAGNTYKASNLIDGNMKTAWAIPASLMGSGVIDFTLKANKIDAVEIVNGYAKSATSYKNNSRPAKMMVYRTDYLSQRATDDNIPASEVICCVDLRDTSKPQKFSVSSRFDNSVPTRKITMIPYWWVDPNGEYDSRYYGDKWDDLCITEFRVIGK